MQDTTKKDIRKIEQKAFELLVNICDAWDAKDIAMTVRRIKLACKFMTETFQRRTDYINSQRGVTRNGRGTKTKGS